MLYSIYWKLYQRFSPTVIVSKRETYKIQGNEGSTIYVKLSKFALKVEFARSSLNHDDVFILDTEDKIYQFNGANSNIQERAKALEAVQFFKDKYHEGMCYLAIVGIRK